MQHWYDTPEPAVEWLVDGLITADGYNAFCGKPKAGKSCLVRNLVASVIKGWPFIGRATLLPENSGRVLYIHLDRKDRDWRVAKELKQLGITREDAGRLTLRLARDIPPSFDERLEWLKNEVRKSPPHLVVIDLLWQFAALKNANDYNQVLEAINTLQDALCSISYQGALVITAHGRKSVSTDDGFDDVLGSTAQRGSFGTLLMARLHKKEKVYTVESDQTDRDDGLGEIPETIVVRNPDRTLELSGAYGDLLKLKKKAEQENDLQRFVAHVQNHPGCEIDTLMEQLGRSKKTILKLVSEASASELLRREGGGIKGDPFRYFVRDLEEGGQHAAA